MSEQGQQDEHDPDAAPVAPATQPWWGTPAEPPSAVLLAGAAVAGTWAGSALVDAPIGINWTLTGLIGLGVLFATSQRQLTWDDRVLLGLAAGLSVVPAIWASPWLVVLCLLGGLGLLLAVMVDLRTWPALPFALPASAVAAVRAIPWFGRLATQARVPREGWSWLRSVVVTVVLLAIVLSLLISGDAAFGELASRILPEIPLATVPIRVFVGGVVMVMILVAGYGLAAAPAWSRLTVPAARRPAREWALPLGAVAGVLALFLLVQVTMLFGGHRVVLDEPGVTYAERAREGFGQLVVVTMIAVALLAWCGRRCDASRTADARLLKLLGGALVGCTLLLVVSALWRMSLYADAYGFSVLRVLVAAFEIWLAGVVLITAACWWPRVAAAAPRLVIGWAGVALLVLSLAGPERMVASANVDRFERTGKIDTEYLADLSEDAWPVLDRLPEPERSCALSGWGGRGGDESEPWYAVNLARHSARSIAPDPAIAATQCQASD